MNIVLTEKDHPEILRYLGYRGGEINEQIKKQMKDAVDITNKAVNVRYNWRLFDIERSNEGIVLCNTGYILRGNSILKHLEGCSKAVLFCVTVGSEFDKQVNRMMINNPAEGVILNACGIAAIEKAADELQQLINNEFEEWDTGIRFSPGYGDLPLDSQEFFVELLNCERVVGVRLNSSYLMNPTKSVTAIAGLIPKKGL